MIWKDLVKVALIGTDRGRLSPESLAFIRRQGIDTDNNPPLLVLEATAICHQFRKAAFLLEPWEEDLPEPIDIVEEKICSPRSSYHLSLILEGPFARALDEFVTTLTASGKSLPPQSLPPLFYQCLDQPELWEKIRPAIGKKGQWLLKLNPDWSRFGSSPDLAGWETGTQKERTAMLSFLRQNKPSEAIALLEKTWKEDSLANKRAFIRTLEINLSDGDEAFLEKALEDSRKEIRTEAARLLAQMGHSKLIGRLWEQLMEYVSLSGEKLEINLPEELTGQLRRDGIRASFKGSYQGGMKAGWIFQIVRRIPPRIWREHFDKTPREWLQLFHLSRWRGLLKPALAEATLMHKDENWAEAFVRHWLRTGEREDWASNTGKEIMRQLSDRSFNEIMLGYIDNYGPAIADDSPAGQLLCLGSHRWTDRLSLLVIKGFLNQLSGARTQLWNLMHYKKILAVGAYCCNPALFENFNTGWPYGTTVWSYWEKDIDRFLRVLLFRKEMLAELKKDQKTLNKN